MKNRNGAKSLKQIVSEILRNAPVSILPSGVDQGWLADYLAKKLGGRYLKTKTGYLRTVSESLQSLSDSIQRATDRVLAAVK